MAVTQELVRSAVASAGYPAIDFPADVPLNDPALKINSLALLTVFINLEKSAKVTLSQRDAIELSRLSIDQIVGWFARRSA
jgi:hypothetical protein